MITVNALTKIYEVPVKDPGLWGSIKSLFDREFREVRAVDGVSFTIEPGERVVMALGAAAQLCPHAAKLAKEEILFGGLNKQSGSPVHSCPGRHLAMTQED